MIYFMPVAKPNVFNIPASTPFLAVLIDALRAGKLVRGFPASADPLELSRATLYLPTRRACRLAREVFLDRLEGEAAILPRIVALGDLDEDEIAFAEAATGDLAEAALALPPAFGALERRFTLAELISKWAAAIAPAQGAPLIANTPEAAMALADALARLMDDMITRQVPWDNLEKLVPEDLDEYWKQSLEFLKFMHPRWRAILAEHNAIEAAERRDRLIEAEAKRLANSDAPVIAAGSTGSMPATANLLSTIASLPHGALVLPGLDMELDDASWALIAGNADDKTHDGAPAAGHAQFAMHALLDRMRIKRSDVEQLAQPERREWLVSEALRPAATTERWSAKKKDFDAATTQALASLSMIEAANAEEEALAIAVALREAVETPGKTAALVTPDRALARRVLAALERWRVKVDDSGGDGLDDTPAGVFARLAADAALGGLEPVTLLALLKHPLLRLGAKGGAHNAAIATLERAILRGPRPKPGSDGLGRALSTFRSNRDQLHRSDPRWLIDDDKFDVAAELIARLGAALAPLERLKPGAHPLAELAKCHSAVISGLGRDGEGEVAAFAGDDGAALVRAFEELTTSPSAAGLAMARSDYAELFHAAIADRMVRRPETRDVRVSILGRLEARLLRFDRVLLGGLNEGTWPPETRNDPWLSRPMRRDLGLDPPERMIGLAAHDFAQGLGAPDVILARAAKVAGSPTVTSRFVQRIAAFAGERWDEVLARGSRYLDLARALDFPAQVKPVVRPAPKPRVRSPAVAPIGHGDRGLAARSLHHLRSLYSSPAAARCGRYAARRARPRHRHSRRHRRLHEAVCRQASSRPHAGIARARREAFRCPRRLSGGARLLVAALLAHRAMVRAMGSRATRRCEDAACRDQRRSDIPGRPARVYAFRHRRPHRAAFRRQLCHPRLQDGAGAHGKAGAHRSRPATDAGSRNPARRQIRKACRRFGFRDRLRHAERRRAGRQAERN